MKARIATVDDYIATQPEALRPVLERLRAVIRKAVPKEAEEAISYGMPVFRFPGPRGMVIYFAAWKEHCSLYPAGAVAELQAEFGDELKPYKMSKGIIQFPLNKRLPTGLIARIAKLCAKEAAARRKLRR